MSTPIPIIVCGQSADIARSVKASLAPQYEVIHVILSPAAGTSELPLLLSGQKPPNHNEVGTMNYAQSPVAIALGGAWNDEMFASLREACEGVSRVPWLRMDMKKARRAPGPGYGEEVVERIKQRLDELGADGGLGRDGVFWY